MASRISLFVTTRDGRIIALDAQNGAVVWNHQYGPGACTINNGGSACYTTSSPAIDPNRLYIYSYGLDGNVHKYQVGDGIEILTGGWPELTTLKGFDEKGSSALSIATAAGVKYLYVVHGGYPGDNGDYQGHVTAINLATGAQKVFNTACSDKVVHLAHFVPPETATTCAAARNAIWARPGVFYDAGTNRILMATGNSFSGTLGQFDGSRNWSESVIALEPDGSGGTGVNAGKPLDSYTPSNWASLDNSDTDIGSTGPTILPVPPTSNVQHLGLQSGKDGMLRLLNLANLSGLGGPGHLGGSVGAPSAVPQGNVVLPQPATLDQSCRQQHLGLHRQRQWGIGAAAQRRRQRHSLARRAVEQRPQRHVSSRRQQYAVLPERKQRARARSSLGQHLAHRIGHRLAALAKPDRRQRRRLRNGSVQSPDRIRAAVGFFADDDGSG